MSSISIHGAWVTVSPSTGPPLASGQGTDLHGTMIALEEANISLRTMGSVRDKLVDGWQTIWNMQI
jgi:flagellar hook-basal body complex protein FliE